VILPLRTATTTAALRRVTHLVVLGGGRRGQKDCSLMAIFVGEIGLLPLHNSERGHSRLIVALMQNFVPFASKRYD
jgi:hypothetical protein